MDKLKATIIYPKGKKPHKNKKKPDSHRLKGAGAGKMKVIIEEANEDGQND